MFKKYMFFALFSSGKSYHDRQELIFYFIKPDIKKFWNWVQDKREEIEEREKCTVVVMDCKIIKI